MAIRIEQDGLCFYTTHLTAKHGIFTRLGGVSPEPFGALNLGGTVGDEVANVHRNHDRMYGVMKMDRSRAVTTWQVHGADVVVAHAPVPNRRWLAKADGIITAQRELPLVMRFADCTPLLYHDPVVGAVGIAHAGWRGTVRGMAGNVIRTMTDAFGSRPEDVQVVIGPAISQACFQVGEEVVEAVRERFGVEETLVRRDPDDGTAYVDLWEANRRDLLSAGVPDANIERMGICTVKNRHEFFSHRGDQGRTGRFGAVISL